ncbi:unnamed protein product [Thelazia callipaeda]|uniref:Ovule protein n=1 Tax=Thelazia callipaeda TaxID=103827 RepID=A0A0N5DC04_THECL|nr:unnamed protein product [Thelazia callipaeda]
MNSANTSRCKNTSHNTKAIDIVVKKISVKNFELFKSTISAIVHARSALQPLRTEKLSFPGSCPSRPIYHQRKAISFLEYVWNADFFLKTLYYKVDNLTATLIPVVVKARFKLLHRSKPEKANRSHPKDCNHKIVAQLADEHLQYIL